MTTERVREVITGDPKKALPPPTDRAPIERSSFSGPAVVDRSRIVEEVVTRRLVVVDSQRRERVVIEEACGGEMMRIEVVAPDYAATFSIDVGIEPMVDQPYALMSLSSGRNSIVLSVDTTDGHIEIERVESQTPNARLLHDGLEFHTNY